MSAAPTVAAETATIEIALISHTNAGKTTLARTLLGVDIGEVRDAPHVTEVAESHVLLQSKAGDMLRLWDTPGFGDTPRLLQRLRIGDNPIGWLLREVWDRYRDRPLWCTQQALRVARESTDVVLYLVNATEDPQDAGYVEPEMTVLGWLRKPIIVLLNQMGPPRPAANDEADVRRWRDHLAPTGLVAEVLAFDAFARCWVQEGVLLDAIAGELAEGKRPALQRLRAEWQRRSLERFDASMHALASALVAAAADHEPVAAPAPANKLFAALGVGRERIDAAHAAATAALAKRLDVNTRAVTTQLIELHQLHGVAAEIVLQRLREHYASSERIDEGKAALWGSVVTGALTGLKADLATGGLTLGGGLLVGGVLGGLAGLGVARGFNKLAGSETPDVHWSEAALTGLTRAAVLRYLAVAHFGRGRGRYVESETPPHWPAIVDEQLQTFAARLIPIWRQARTEPQATEPALAACLSTLVAAVLERLYPGRVPKALDPR